MVKEFVGTLNGCGALGALSKSASDKIKKNSSAIAQVLRKAKRLNGLAGLGDTASKSDIVTVQESIELLNKDNGLMNDDELEMLELEAEALALELELGSDSVSGIDDMEFYFNESEDVAVVEGVSEEDYDDALALVKKELDARLGKNRYRLWSDWHIGDKWNFIIKRK